MDLPIKTIGIILLVLIAAGVLVESIFTFLVGLVGTLITFFVLAAGAFGVIAIALFSSSGSG